MPTGYTAHIADGTETTLRQFALRCARGMGALATMRDDPWDAPIPTALPPSSYHADQIAETKSEIDRLNAMTPDALASAALADFVERYESWTDTRTKDKERHERYTTLLNQLETASVDWPEGFAAFMRSQLEESRKFDCHTGGELDRWNPEPKPETPEQWRADRLAQLYKDLAYHTVEHQKELDRTAERNAWLAKLHNALKGL